MFRRLITILIAAWAVYVLPVPVLAAGVEFPRGSRIGLEPPSGFTPSNRLVGFEDQARGGAINLLDLPEPAYQAFEKSAFGNTKDLTVDKRELFAFRDGVGFLITAREMLRGSPYRSWYLLANITNKEIGHIAALVAIREPETALAVYPERVIRDALASVSFRNPPLDEILGMLPFKLTTMAGLRLMKAAAQGVVILIDGQTDDIANHPYMAISVGRGAPEAADLRPKFAQDLLTSVPLPGLTITSGEPMRINNQPGFELRAKATGAGGKPIALVQWLRFSGGSGFVRVVGVANADRWDEMFPRFRAVRDGIARR